MARRVEGQKVGGRRARRRTAGRRRVGRPNVVVRTVGGRAVGRPSVGGRTVGDRTDERRTVGRRAVVAAGLAALAGCGSGGSATGPDPRTLTPTQLKVRRHPEGWLLSTIVETTPGRGGAGFHDVALLGFAADGRRVCEKPLGDIEPRGGVQTVRVTALCSGFPRAVTFAAAESPCDEGTAVRVAVAGRTPTGDTPAEEREPIEWTTRDRGCEEGLPPAIEGESDTTPSG